MQNERNAEYNRIIPTTIKIGNGHYRNIILVNLHSKEMKKSAYHGKSYNIL